MGVRSVRPERLSVATVRKAKADFQEIGASGLTVYGGQIREEWLPQLYGPRQRRVWREMRDNDPIIGGILFAVDMMMREVPWHVEQADDQEVSQRAQTLVDTALGDMSATWETTLSSIFSFLPFGWSAHELVYKIRGGDVDDPTQRSKYDDGMIGWRKIALRRQDSLVRWLFDDQGGIQAMEQATSGYGAPYAGAGLASIPIEKLLLFRTDASSGNPEGRSVLRNAYVPWYRKKHIEETEAIGIERDLAGLPVAWLPPEYLADDAPTEMDALYQTVREIVADIKRDDQEGVVFPLEYDEQGNKKFDLTLLTTGGRRQFDTDSVIGRYNQNIAMVILADFLLLGHEKVGSFALGSSKIDLFSIAIGAWLDEVASVFNQYAIPRLLRLNGIPLQSAPMLVHEDVKEVDLAKLAAYITALAAAGMPMFPDDQLENWLRSIGGMPAKPDPAMAGAQEL